MRSLFIIKLITFHCKTWKIQKSRYNDRKEPPTLWHCLETPAVNSPCVCSQSFLRVVFVCCTQLVSCVCKIVYLAFMTLAHCSTPCWCLAYMPWVFSKNDSNTCFLHLCPRVSPAPEAAWVAHGAIRALGSWCHRSNPPTHR